MFGISWLQPEQLVATMGGFAILGICLIVFIETGLLVGFFLPGDSLLFVTGLLVAGGAISWPIWAVCLLISASAWLGDQTGYWIGRRVGPAVFNREESRFFSHKNVDRAHVFFERYGARAIILAHFVPVMRTFVPVAAGVGEMNYRRFLKYNVWGVLGWGSGVTLMGYFLGGIAFVAQHVEYFTLGFVVLSTIPIALEVIRARKGEKSAEATGSTDRV
ncbi:MAG: VTT domain-containing protein [Actinomycetales bacterium]|nr:VTT domain-containing protein [Actinomycetales bacterium]